MAFRMKMATLIASAALAGGTAFGGVAFAQNSPPTTPNQAPALQGNNYQGSIASINTAQQEFVITTVFGARNVTVETTDKTHYNKETDIGLSGLQTGDRVLVMGQVNSAQGSVAAKRIQVQGPRKHPKAPGGRAALAGRVIGGIISSTSPLTITGDDGKTYTIVPLANGIPVIAPQPAAFGDIQVGENVSVHGKPTGADTLTAHTVDIRLVGRGGKLHLGRHRKKLAAQ